MSATGYVSLTRQSGLMAEMQAIANNIANVSTTGYRREGVVFSEYVKAAGPEAPSISFATAGGRMTDAAQGGLSQTNGTFDLAIEGEGFFQVETPEGPRLTRAGAFLPDAEGNLVTPDGNRVLDAGGAPVFIPPGTRDVAVAPDGTLTANGQPLALMTPVLPADPLQMIRGQGTTFAFEGELVPAPGLIRQGFLESSNVDPVLEIARMIEVQRAYELGQTFMDREDERVRNLVRTLGR